jgi:secondary thiamine-phosphate synthase enzyme|tara:strand:- start:281 stop:787 length:507 start_codon:yes stop_codon:yes gene_type:complete
MNPRQGVLEELTSSTQTVEGTMKVSTFTVSIESVKAPEFVDITENVIAAVAETGVTAGVAVVYSNHTTAAIKINEWEPLLLEDLERLLEHIAPRDGDYRHNDFAVRTVNMTEDESPNGHAHCQHLTLSTSESIPIVGGKLQLGTYQRVFFIELDCPRSRETTVQVMGV